MFARILKARSNEYAVILRSYRNSKGKVCQKTILNLGPVTKQNKEQMLIAAKNTAKVLNGEAILNTGESIQEIQRVNWGASIVVDKLWEVLKLDAVISDQKKIEAIKLMLSNRLIKPCSKLNSYQNQKYFDGFNDVKLENLYRGLDLLNDNKEAIKKHIIKKQIAKNKVDVALFDVTTMYFESCKSKDIRQFGYSKDCKFNEVQVVLSLIISSDGMPLGYEIFPGNTYEGSTLSVLLDKFKSLYKINKLIIVADRGIGSKSNLEEIKSKGYDYVIGGRLRSMSKAMQSEAMDMDSYKDIDSTVRYKIHSRESEKDGDNVLFLYSSKRAEKDALDRSRLVEKAKLLLKKGTSEKGASKYIKKERSSKILDNEKIEKDALFDGHYALNFSDQSLSAKDVNNIYHQLWKIEESFRTLKSVFEIRPMYHWTDKRIEGHVLLNFLLLVMENRLLSCGMSHKAIREALSGMEKSVLKIGEQTMYSYASLDESQTTLLKTLKIKRPQNHII